MTEDELTWIRKEIARLHSILKETKDRVTELEMDADNRGAPANSLSRVALTTAPLASPGRK